MRRKFVQATLVLAMLSGIGAVATNSGGAIKADAAITKTVRTSKDHTGSKWYDYYYYSNGAMRSINNLVKDTYNFSEESFTKDVSTYADKLLGEVNYDDTSREFTKVGSDNLASLNTILKMPSKKTQWLTNYTVKELKDRKLIPSSDSDNSEDNKTAEDAQASNMVDNGEATTSDLVTSLTYLINKDYYTVPRNLKVHKTMARAPLTATITEANGANWFYANKSSVTNGEKVNNSNNLLKSDLIMMMSKIYKGVHQSSALILSDYSERDGNVWSTEEATKEVDKDKNYSTCYTNPLLKGSEYYGSAKCYYDKLTNDHFEGTYGGGHLEGDTDYLYNIVDGMDYHGVQFVGDYWVYYDPNVYELYLSEALNDGIITISDLSNNSANPCSKFRSDYKNKRIGNWGNGSYHLNGKITSDSLGYSKQVNYSSAGMSITSKKPTYFGDKENMTMIEALRIIEAYMRANDENMSKTEEMIVRYKLGLTVLSYLDSDDCSTVTYLVAKGILDGNSSSLSSALYDDATIAKLYPIIYRVANKDARCDFSTIQLTDSETYWASQDFSSDTFNIFQPSTDIIHETTNVVEEGESRKDNEKDSGEWIAFAQPSTHKSGIKRRSGLLGFGAISVSAASTSQSKVKTYKITKVFDTKSVYKIGTTTIAQLYHGKDKSSLDKYNIVKITKNDKYEYAGSKHSVYEVTFEVTATKRSVAIASVDKQITILSDLDEYKKTVSGVTNVSKDGKVTSLISQSSLKQAFSNITVLEDKILMNNVTGTMAYFSYDSKITLVGSQIISSTYPCISKAGNEVYYDLNALIPLLSSAYVDTIGPQINIVTTDIEHTHTIKISTDMTDSDDYLMSAQYLRMFVSKESSKTKDDKDTDLHIGYSCLGTDKVATKIAADKRNTTYFVKLNTLSSASNQLTKSFSVNYNGTSITGTIVLDLQYVVPDVSDFSSWLQSQVLTTDTFTYQEAAQILMTPPDKLHTLKGFTNLANSLSDADTSALNSWYYSNYGMANALCNFMYETSGYVYVPSGYVCPSVTLLIDNVKGKIGSKTFSAWCKSSNKKSAKTVRDAVFEQVFKGFSLGDDYKKYNGGSDAKFWHNYYQYDSTIPDYTQLGFKSPSKGVTNTIQIARVFDVYEQPTGLSSSFGIKLNKFYKVSKNQSFKTYGRKYAVSATGAVFQKIDTLGSIKQPLFSYTVNHNAKTGLDSTLHSLKLNSRSATQLIPNRGQIVKYNKSYLRYDSTCTSAKSRYYTFYESMPYKNGKMTDSCVQLRLSRNPSKMQYSMKYFRNGTNSKSLEPLDSNSFAEFTYKVSYASTLGQYGTCPSNSSIRSMLRSKNSNIFLDPSMIASKTLLMQSLFGKKSVYIYTDKGVTNSLASAGKIYYWNGSALKKISSSSAVTDLFTKNITIYAIPLYYAPCDSFFFKLNSAKEICLGTNPVNKALNYLQFDLTSINNQMIDAYLQEQQGVQHITDLENGAEVMIGDTVWTKDGKWWQSSPISDSKSIKAAISKHKNMQWYSQKTFSGLYITVSGKQYPVANYVEDTTMGKLVGSKKQLQKGVVFVDGNTVKVKKGTKVSNANSKTKAQYLSVRCKFSKDLFVRPIDSSGLKFTYLGHSSTGLTPSADYPFFDEQASWNKEKTDLYTIATSSFKPSSAFNEAKKNFISEYHELLAEDSWNLIWVIIIMLASYLMIMSWFSYGVITLGVGRSGFEALLMRDRTGNKKGIDFIKIATFGLYSIEREVSLARMIIVSIGCCVVILTILVVIF